MPRDPKRIKPLLNLIERMWVKAPDLRLCQLLGNCFDYNDLYYVEDNRLTDELTRVYGALLINDKNKEQGTGKDIREKRKAKPKSTRI